MPVNTPCGEYNKFIERWTRGRDCYDGSDAIKSKGDAYLPKLDSHRQTTPGLMNPKSTKYEEYKLRALFYNAVGRTVDGLAGAIFQREPNVKLPAVAKDIVDDITLTGVTLELFALHATREVLCPGRYGILVDMAVDEKDKKSGTATTNRPYWVGYCAEDIVAWRQERLGGDETVTRIVLRESYEKPDPKDPFVSKTHEQYRVLELNDGVYTASIWRRPRGDDGDFIKQQDLAPTRRGENIPFIPFVFIGPTTVDADPEKPPLDDLVNVNLSHYRTQADLEHGRHYTALPTPWVAGVVGGNESAPLALGSGTAWILEKDGKAGMLEFSGAGLSSLVTADQDKRKMMATLGARLLEDQPSTAETAMAVSMRHAGEHATLRTVAQAIEQSITMALQCTCWWMGSDKLPREVAASIEFNKDFFAVRMNAQDMQSLVSALQAEAISFATFYAALQRGEIARPGVTAEEEMASIKKTGEMFKKQPEAAPGAVGPDGEPIAAVGPDGEPVPPKSVPPKKGEPVPPKKGEPVPPKPIPPKKG